MSTNINGIRHKTYLRKTPKWIPKSWKPKYSQIVFMSAQGHSNEAVANVFRMGPQQISNILNLPEAIRMKNELCSNLEESLKEDINRTLEQVGRKAVERIKETIYNDQLYEHNPLAIFDRSKAFLQCTGVFRSGHELNGGGNGNGGNTTNVIIGNDIAKVLGEAIIKSQRIKDSNEILQLTPGVSK